MESPLPRTKNRGQTEVKQPPPGSQTQTVAASAPSSTTAPRAQAATSTNAPGVKQPPAGSQTQTTAASARSSTEASRERAAASTSAPGARQLPAGSQTQTAATSARSSTETSSPRATAGRTIPRVSRQVSRPKEESGKSKGRPFVPMILMALTLVLMIGFQTFQALEDRWELKDRFAQQESTLQEANKVRGQLDSIAKQTYQLSINGNKNAAKIVVQMKKAGLTFNPGNQ